MRHRRKVLHHELGALSFAWAGVAAHQDGLVLVLRLSGRHMQRTQLDRAEARAAAPQTLSERKGGGGGAGGELEKCSRIV